ncbi:MAG: hypothetical protein QXD48_02370 [Candidatus Aenigmatarchaeota archaeon]
MNRREIIEYYSREEIINELLKNAKNREIVGAFWDGTYDKRPNIIQYKNDIVQMAKNGVVSFHFSVEQWSNPMAISADNYNKLRIGWDMIIDVDSKLGLEEAKIATEMICKLLEKYGIKNYGLKFSGRRGFHISLPWIMFPKEIDYKPLTRLYPKIPRIIARFIRKKISEDLMKELIRMSGAKKLIEILGEVPSKMNPFYFVEVEKDWGNRHMFRAPYSLNEKTWLVSLPIKFSQLKNFSPEIANPNNIKIYDEFFKGEEGEGIYLLTDALDWYAIIKKEKPKKEVTKINWEKKITEDLFPPCIKSILSGLSDGRKRSIFTLVNFLRMCNWNWQEIEDKVFEWNTKNKQQLPRNIILSQLRWSQQNQMNPANCDNDLFYSDIGICKPDDICKGKTDKIIIKNPLSYPFKKMKLRPRIRRGFSCDICGKEFKTMNGLNYHKGRYH